jgi:hypothetical protein
VHTRRPLFIFCSCGLYAAAASSVNAGQPVGNFSFAHVAKVENIAIDHDTNAVKAGR